MWLFKEYTSGNRLVTISQFVQDLSAIIGKVGSLSTTIPSRCMANLPNLYIRKEISQCLNQKTTLNNNEILNIELQVYPDKYWISRSIIYLCRAYDNIGSGDNYSLVKPATLFCITDKELIPQAEAEFYAKYRLTNLKNHHLYTDKFGINMLQLNHTDLATKEDIRNNLVYWANLFKATTWEEFKNLAKNHPDIEEVGNLIFELNYDNQAKELLEGQRRYREQMNSQYTAGYTDAEEKYENEIVKLQAELKTLQAELEKYKNANK